MEEKVCDEQQSLINCISQNYYDNHHQPIPTKAIYILLSLFITGLGVSIFIFALVHNATFFLTFLFTSVVVTAFVAWNILGFCRNAALFLFLNSYPDSDLRFAQQGQLVKITGPVSCGNICLDSSYERVAKCVYTSTLLYEYQGVGLGLKALDSKVPCFLWRLAYSERYSTDFYISDRNSGIQALVKAGFGCRVIPLITENRLVSTRKNRILSPNLTKWLKNRKLSADSRLIRLQEGYIKEGDHATVIGMLSRSEDNGIVMVVEPPELVSTGCLWQRLLLPVDFDSVILGLPVNDCPEF